jgi:serine/threonine protein kinase
MMFLPPPGEALRRWDPERIGPYSISGRLGAGAMGQVYLGRSAAGRLVAVKTIRIELAEEPGFRARFAHEVAAARRVSGLFSAAVVAADPEADLPWLATAYVPAPTLSRLVQACGPMPVPAVRWLAAGCAEALESIHGVGLLHRDLKPSNVLVAPDGPRVIDFGVARPAERIQLTVTRGAVGTPAYMAPEQARDAAQASMASDVFSFGATLVFAATGHAPYQGETVMDILVRLATEPPDLSGLPAELTGLITACLQRVPKERPTWAAIISQLGSFADAASAGAGQHSYLPDRAMKLIASYQHGPRRPAGSESADLASGADAASSAGSASSGEGPAAAAGPVAAARAVPAAAPPAAVDVDFRPEDHEDLNDFTSGPYTAHPSLDGELDPGQPPPRRAVPAARPSGGGPGLPRRLLSRRGLNWAAVCCAGAALFAGGLATGAWLRTSAPGRAAGTSSAGATANPGRAAAKAKASVSATAARSTPQASSSSVPAAAGNPAGQNGKPPPLGPLASSLPGTASTPELGVNKESGDGATLFTVTGVGFAPGAHVVLTLVGYGPPPNGQEIVHSTAAARPAVSSHGTFTFAVTDGNQFVTGALGLGLYEIIATEPGAAAVAAFQILPLAPAAPRQ